MSLIRALSSAAVLAALLFSLSACDAQPVQNPETVTENNAGRITEAATETIQKTTEETEPMNETITEIGAVSITRTENAVVCTADGLSYTAENASGISPKGIELKKALVLTPTLSASAAFNRVTFTYSADAPLKVSAVYPLTDGNEISDTFYLEAGEDQSFSLLIDGYLKEKRAAGLSSLTVTPCEYGTAHFLLTGLKTEDYPVYTGSIYRIEGNRYTVGIKLGWGGGICEIKDTENPVPGLTNLVNQCDTGRLIQQSYYGTGANDEYTPGFYNGSTWSYNPVQGGNQYNQPSRLIDVVVSDNSVFIRTQPADWSNKDFLTPSYMENTYTVFDDRIAVDNRFVDFSGWDHGCGTQEIPAFYTVSYLGTFVHYQGEHSWENDALSYEPNLNFWGDSRYHNDCDFAIEASQTETWCAWVNEKDDYGIGLYVPNADTLLAGRFSYNGSKDAYNGATNYVAPVNRFSLGNYTPITYSYLITTGSVGEIRNIFTENRDFADNASLRQSYISLRPYRADYTDLVFDNSGVTGALGGSVNSTAMSYDEKEKAVRFTCTGGDPYIGIRYGNSSVPLSADTFKTITFTYCIPESNSDSSYDAELFLCAGEVANPTAGFSTLLYGLEADGAWHTVSADLSDLDFWTGDIHSVRIDYFNSAEAGDSILIKEIKLS